MDATKATPSWLIIAGAFVGSGLVGGVIGGLSVVLGFAEVLVSTVVFGLVAFAVAACFFLGMKTRQAQKEARKSGP